MDSQLYVQIENKSLIPFFDLEKDVSRSLTLTTIKDYQRKAVVTIYSRNADGSNHKLKQFSLDPIPPAPAGEPKIGLKARKSGKRAADLTLTLNRKYMAGGTVKVPGTFPWKAILLVLLLLLLFGGAVWGIMQLFTSAAAPDATSREKAGVTQTERVAEAPGEVKEVKQEETRQEPVTQKTQPAPLPSPSQAQESPEKTPAPKQPEITTPPPVPAAVPEPEPLIPAQPLKKIIYFTPDSAYLTAEARNQLDTIIPELKKYPDAGMEISGHCAPHGTEKGRQELSSMRAEAVAAYLRQHGLKVDRVSGLGARFPATRDLEQQNLNRRVEILQQDTKRE